MLTPLTLTLVAVLAQAAPAAQTTTRDCGQIGAEAESARKPCRVDVSVFAAAEQPTVFSDVKIRSTDLLEASLSVENKGGSLTYAPLLYGLRTYRPVLSELRLRLSQKDNLTTFGTGVQYNPLQPRSRRGAALWTQLWEELNAKGGTAPPAYALRTRLGQRLQAMEKAITDLRAEYATVEKIPTGATTAQLDERRHRQTGIADEITDLRAEIVATKEEIAAIEAAEKKRTDSRIQAYSNRLLQSPLPVIGLNYNATLFTILAGSDQDANNNGLNDLEHRLKRHGLSGSLDSRLSERLQISGLFSRDWDRASAEAGTNYADVYGVGVTVGGIVAILDKEYKQSAAYAESLFIPSIVLGGALEYRRCANSTDVGVTCPDKLERLTVFTPFVDLKVSKTAQFRIGAPLRFSTRAVAGGAAGTDVGVVTALTLQLGEPK